MLKIYFNSNFFTFMETVPLLLDNSPSGEHPGIFCFKSLLNRMNLGTGPVLYGFTFSAKLSS